MFIKDKKKLIFINQNQIKAKPFKRSDNRYFVRDNYGTYIELTQEDFVNLGGKL